MPKVIYKIKKSKNAGLNRLFGLAGTFGTAVVLTLLALPVISVSSVYADGLDYNVQIRPSLNVTLSSSTVSLVLNPSTSPFGKANLDVSVGTNNPTGYKLYINTTNGNDKLTNNTTLTTPVYIDTLSSSTTETTFPANSWGYRISSLSSGNEGGDSSITDTEGNNFFKYTSGAMISSASSAVTNSTSTLTFGAKVDYDKPAGIYSLDFSFRAVPSISTYNIQNLPESECTSDSTVVTDSRDGQAYTVTRLGDGNCWMTQNLRFTGTTLTPADSDVKSNKTLTYGELATGDTSANSYTDPKIHKGVDNNNNATVWYNYVAASAGTITGGSNTTEASESVCPAGWRLPTNDEISGITGYVDTFSPVVGGRYDNGSLDYLNGGWWWSSTVGPTEETRYRLGYDGSPYLYTGYSYRQQGNYVRCIRKKSIQDYTKSLCQTQAAANNVTLTDERDGNNYTARYINGNCWMTQNLRFGGTDLDPSTTNIDVAKTITYGDLTSGNSYTEARIHDSGNTISGVWYNYAAASAMTITGDNNEAEAQYSLCPAGWRLPTYVEIQTIGDVSSTYVSGFSPVTGGRYASGSLDHLERGLWWSSTTSGISDRHVLYYYESVSNLGVDVYNRNIYGLYVRCVAE